MADLRALEDLIIDTVYQGLISGKIDQQHSVFEVQSAMGRDIGPDDVDEMIGKLSQWMDASQVLIDTLKDKATFANQKLQVRVCLCLCPCPLQFLVVWNSEAVSIVYACIRVDIGERTRMHAWFL